MYEVLVYVTVSKTRFARGTNWNLVTLSNTVDEVYYLVYYGTSIDRIQTIRFGYYLCTRKLVRACVKLGKGYRMDLCAYQRGSADHVRGTFYLTVSNTRFARGTNWNSVTLPNTGDEVYYLSNYGTGIDRIQKTGFGYYLCTRKQVQACVIPIRSTK
jgi:hypothetical protein